ncbi:MAG: multicopper oxidase domain-containing protein [Acidobacteriota bacterium]|nr:multicopper oxidase domain-containing protein [Acidobacteriota bacterium]
MATKHYEITATSVTVWFNKYGDHDHDGMMYIPNEYLPILQYVKDLQSYKPDEDDAAQRNFQKLMARREKLKTDFSLAGDAHRAEEWLPDTKAKARLPHPLVVPLVLRACQGDTVKVKLTNQLKNRKIGIHLVGPGTDAGSDGSDIWDNSSSLVEFDEARQFTWKCDHEGVFVFHDAGDFRGDEAGTNAHGLFGALIVEPAGSRWTDPQNKEFELSSGLYADVHQKTDAEINAAPKAPFPQRDNVNPPNPAALTNAYPNEKASFREYVIFIHDEPHWVPPHDELEKNPCDEVMSQEELAHGHTAGSLMPISYRAEPMISRERELWKMMKAGLINEDNIVVNEEQHHSSWLFGEPATPVLKAYLGDPVRIRLVHAGVKETHVFHLHVYEWHTVAGNPQTNIIDAITISPQTAHTIQPLYGAGNRQMVPGDVIWHCHLYPHFHHGMWGMFRMFDRLQNGAAGERFHGDTGAGMSEAEFNALSTKDKRKFARRLGFYPDETPIQNLEPLPDREPPPAQDLTNKKLGYPHFIAGEVGQKSFIPPWHKPKADAEAEGWTVADYDYREPTRLELNTFNIDPKPGELFTAFPHNDSPQSVHKNEATGNALPRSATVKRDVDVLMTPIKYNDHGWWDPHGHLYALKGHGIETFSEIVHEALHHAIEHKKQEDPTLTDDEARALVDAEGLEIEPQAQNPLFLRCNKTNVMQMTLHNRLERDIAATPFDSAWYKGREKNCDEFKNYRGECGLHVHIVKFDPIAADGAATGWNYLSAPRFGKKSVYRWWADEEFGTIFTHDHLFANFRQKHGLFAALLVEPENATFHDPDDHGVNIVDGTEAVIKYSENGAEKSYREFCLGNGDWVPLFQLPPEVHLMEKAGEIHQVTHHDKPYFVAKATYQAHGKTSEINIIYGMPIEPPNHPDSHDDNGVFGVNYKCEPLAERPNDPSEWFNSKTFVIEGEHGKPDTEITYGDPFTPVFRTLAGDPVRLRLVQGSHEEQHSFQLHGMRWRRFWKDANSPLKNQQTLGISEAFSFDVHEGLNQNYAAGDYLWKYASSEDLWLGCWGFIRAFEQNSDDENKPLPLPSCFAGVAVNHSPAEQCRRFKIKAISRNIQYNSVVSDPFGLVYQLTAVAEPNGSFKNVPASTEPLVLRCRKGEWLAVEVSNEIPDEIEAEPMAPKLPHDDADRKVSNKVSLHADLLYYDVKTDDGSNVGDNPNTTIENGGTKTYFWQADEEGCVLLQDMADFRNHRHHGLIGAIIVHPENTTPYKLTGNGHTANIFPNRIAWYGTRVTLVKGDDNSKTEDQVLFVQDGLRYFLHGNPVLPVGDMSGDLGEDLPDTEDQGLKGFNYRSEPTSHARGYVNKPATPVVRVKKNAKVQLHLIGACDKPRNHSFTIHGHSWREWEHWDDSQSPQVSSEGGISSGFVKTLKFKANADNGYYMYRTGVLKYVVEQGLWGVLRVVD